MKFRSFLAIMAFACVGFAMPALAQAPAPQAEADLQQYISKHHEVQRNPSLLNNPEYLRNHPDLAHFIETHPNIQRQTMRMGAYDSNHQWRDPDWWHQNNPNWVAANHQEWNQSHPEWMRAGANPVGEGDYDAKHTWRARDWWVQHHPNWVKQHHPEWAEAHGNEPYHAPYGNGKSSE
jgi:hypothetical protein